MPWTRDELDARLLLLEAQVPVLLRDRNAFFRAFEDEVLVVLSEAVEADQGYAQAALEAIVERSGVNG